MFTVDPLAADALRIRRTLRPALFAPDPAAVPDLDAAINRHPADAVRLLLVVERCAAVLLHRLQAGGVLPALRPPVRAAIEDQARIEVARHLAARAQLARIVELVGRNGDAVIALKGARDVARRRPPLGMVDLDLLLREEAAHRLWRQLQERGYYAEGPGSARHLATLRSARLSVDLHVALDLEGEEVSERVWDRAEAVPEMPGLLGLAPPDHLWHLLVHTVVDHVERRSSLRDLIMVARALTDLPAPERPALDAAIDAHRAADELRALLEEAEAINAGHVPADAHERIALAGYHLARTRPRSWIHPRFYVMRTRWVMVLLTSWQRESAVMWRSVRRPSQHRTTLPVARHLAAPFPAASRAVRGLVRLAGQLVALGAAIPTVVAVRRHRLR